MEANGSTLRPRSPSGSQNKQKKCIESESESENLGCQSFVS